MTEEEAGREKQRLSAAGSGTAKRGLTPRDVIRNITRRKPIGKALRESEERDRDLLESLCDVVYEFDTSGRITYVSPGIEDVGGYSPSEMLGRPFTEFVHTDDLPSVTEKIRKRPLGNREPSECRLLTKSGEVRWVRSLGQPVYEGDRVVYFRGVLTDITEQKRAEGELRESEERYRQLVELSPYAIAVHSEGKTLYANAAALSLLGASTPDEVIGRPMWDFIHPDYQEAARARTQSSRQEEGEVDFVEQKLVRIDGQVIDTESVAFAIEYQGRPARQVIVTDVTERKRAEEALRESEERLRDLFEAAFEGIVAHEKGVILDANPAFEKMFGYKLSELVGKSVLDLTAEESRDLLMEKIRSKAGEPYEAVGLRKDGTTFTGELIAKEHEYKGRLVRVATIRDITERKRAEEALRESEERYRNLVENINDAVYEADASGRITYIGPVIEEVGGVSPSEVIGRPFAELVHPDDLPLVVESFRERLAGKTTPIDYRVLDKAGEAHWVRSFGRPILEGDRVVGVRGVLTDVTERKRAEEALRESEERFRVMFESSQSLVTVADETGKTILANAAWRKTLGYTPETQGDPIEKIHPDDRQRVLEAWQAMGDDESAFTDIQYKYKTASGQYVDLETTVRQRMVGGKPMLYVSAHDITERKRAEEALRESEEKYRTLVENANDYIIILQHGRTVYQNPSYAEFLGYSVSETVGRSYLDFIAEEDRGRVSRRYEKRLRGEAAPNQYEVRVLTKDGRRATMEVKPSVIQYKGEPAIMVVLHDISERKRAEEALIREKDIAQRYLDVAEVILMAIDREGRVTLINQKGCQILGYEEEEIVGQNWCDAFLPATVREGIRDVFHWSMAGEIEPVEYHENPIRTKSGEERIIAWHNTVVRDETGNITGTLSSGEDITERKKMGEALQAAREELEARVERQMLRRNPYHLTFRELTVLHLVAIGRSDKEIGTELSISPLTAQKHISNILGKMGATSRTEAGVRAIREGLLD